MNHVLIDAALIAPEEDMALDAGGVWRPLHFIDADGKLTTKAKAIQSTIVEPPEKGMWDFERGGWKLPPPVLRSPKSDIELQYINGVLAKYNYLQSDRLNRMTGEYFLLRYRMITRLGISNLFFPYAVSAKPGKETMYSSLVHLRQFGLLNFTPDSRYGNNALVALSYLTDSQTLSYKLYDVDYGNYLLPSLPQGSVPHLGVTTTYEADGKRTGDHEIFFKVDSGVAQAWAADNGFFVCNDPRVTYYGVSFDDTGRLTGTFKEVVETRIDEIEPTVERVWVGGNIVRSGVSPHSSVGIELVKQIDAKWAVDMDTAVNVSSTDYDLGIGEPVRIISLYFNREPISDKLRAHFKVPAGIVPPDWYGIKYAPKYNWVWLKLADTEYSRYSLPSMPENAHRAFGVATVYPETSSQPANHNATGGLWRDCSFITKDHAAVRRWCIENGLADPIPQFPDILPLWGVYRITHHAVTMKILRVKFYEYFGRQRYDMEGYLDSMLKGRELGLMYDRMDEDFSCIESFGRVFANANKR